MASKRLFFDIKDNNPPPSEARKWGTGQKPKWHKRSSGSSFERSRKDLSNDSLCDFAPRGVRVRAVQKF